MKTTQTLALALLTAAASGRPTRRGALFGGDSNNGDACIAAQALADGIQSNINLQRGEQASLARVKDAVSGGDLVDLVAFAAAKQQLLDFVNAGIAVRTNNQLIAPGVNAALAGLGVVSSPEGRRSVFCFAARSPMLTSVAYFQVQQAQAEELALATALAGNANDLAIIDQLEKDFAGGIQQNEQNALDVSLFFHILSKEGVSVASRLKPSEQSPVRRVEPGKGWSACVRTSALPKKRGKGALSPGRVERGQLGLFLQKRQTYGNEYVTEPMPTAWIFGAMMISIGVVLAALLLLRNRRRENLARAEAEADADGTKWSDDTT